MQQLSGLDATFLYFETATSPMHIGSVALYDGSTLREPITYARLLANTGSRLHLARCFRQKVASVPFDLDHPYWVEDEDFDLEFHVRHIALPEPGDWRQLCEQAARIHARPLDLARPLWEMYLIEGVERIDGVPEGSFAILTKIHHAAIDGVSGAELTAAIHDLEPDAAPPPPERAWTPESVPGALDLLGRSLWNNVRQPFRAARVLGEAVPALARVSVDRLRNRIEPVAETVPRTRFNGTVTQHRVVGGVDLLLDEVREIKKTVAGATVNDAILAVCGGGLRRYLEAHGELPEASLIAMAPINVRTEAEAGTAGNRVSTMSVPLRSDLADPAERLRAVREGTQASKKLTEAIGASLMTDSSQFIPGGLAGLAARAYTRLGLANRIDPFFNTVVTNVPGPQVPLYSAGARLISNLGLGPILDGMGLIHPIFSYCGRITVGFTSCRRMLPDPAFYEDCLRGAFEDLREATLGPRERI